MVCSTNFKTILGTVKKVISLCRLDIKNKLLVKACALKYDTHFNQFQWHKISKTTLLTNYYIRLKTKAYLLNNYEIKIKTALMF